MADVNMNIILGVAGAGGVMSAIKSVSSSLGSGGLSGALMAAGAAAVVGLGVAAVNASADFQQQMLKNQALAGLTADQYTAMSQQILALSPQLGQAPSDLAKGLYNVLSAGIPASQAMSVLKLATESAVIGMTDSATVTDALTSALNAFSIPATNAQSVMDAMNETVTSGKMQWADYAHVVGVISVTANAAGISFNDMNAALATMTDTGLSAQRASMDLNFLMRDLGPNAAKVAKNAEAMGISFDLAKFQGDNLYQKLQYLKDVTHGNQEEMLKLTGGAAGWMAAQMILANNGQLYANSLNNIQNASQGAGATAKAWAVTQEGLNVQMAKAGAAIQVLLITLGNMLVPAITGVVSALSPLISQFASWIANIDHARPILIGLAAVVLSVLVPAMVSLAVSVAAATWPIILIGVTVAGLAAIFQHFYETNAGFRNFINGLGADIQRAWGALGDFVGKTVGTMANTVATDTLKTKLAAVNNTIEQKQALINHYEDQKQQIENIMGETSSAVERKALETKLKTITEAEDQAQKVVDAAKKQKAGIAEQLAQTDPIVKLHSLQQKDDHVNAAIASQQAVVDAYEKEKNQIVEQLQHTRSAAQREELLRELAQVESWQRGAEGVKDQLEKQKQTIDASLKQQTAIVNNGALGRALAGIWERLQQVWSWIQSNVPPVLDRIGQGFQAVGGFIASMQPYFQRIGLLFQDMGGYLKTDFLPVWTNLADSWKKDILPSLQQLWQALQPLIPIFEKIGMLIGGLLIIAIGVLWAAITGLVKALAGMFSQLGPMIGGVVQIITGAIQVISGVVTFFVDLLTGKWQKLGGDLAMMAKGILNIFGGFFQVLGSMVQVGIQAIVGFFTGFIDGIIGFFQHLFERLVGHSIIPDMITAIVGWFASLPGAVFGIVDGWAAALIKKFQTLWSTIVSDAKSIFGTIGDAIAGILKGAINGFIINPINSIIAKLDSISVDTPFGHVGFNIPYIPRLAAGGTAIAAGLALVGERGPELAYLPTGASVIPLPGGAGANGGRFGQQTTNYITINLATMARTQSEVSRLVDLFEAELARGFRLQTSGYNSGNIF